MHRAGAFAGDLGRGLAFFACLGAHLRRLPTPEEARATLRRRLEHRQADFLDLTRRAIYAHRGSPYRRLLCHAGCEYGDLERLVRREGVEGALTTLFQEGVYLTASELKGERPVGRGSLKFSTSFRQVRNPRWLVPAPVWTTTARPRGLVPIHFAMFQDLAVTAGLSLDARGGTGWVHALWGWPQVGSILWLVRHLGWGYRTSRWFSRTPLGSGLGVQDRWIARLMHLSSALGGCPAPRLEYVPLEDPTPIVRWMRRELLAGRTPHLLTIVSAAVHTARVAFEAGADLSGAQFGISGEPVTADRLATIRRIGAAACPSYGAKETGLLAHGCLAPLRSDDMHLYHDLYAVIQPGNAGATSDLPSDALLVSSLRLSWPLVIINVSPGDRADLERRSCGCPLERLGWAIHVHTVRGFDKLKIGGTPLLAEVVVHLLEAELPRRFGGGPTDYQLVEEDADAIDGQTRLRLLVHPSVGPLDTGALAEAFLEMVREAGLQVDRVWSEKRWLVVERRPPLLTAGGKVYHIHRASWPAVQ